MEKGYGLYGQGSSGWTINKNEEFQEEDVWAVFKERKDSDSRFLASFREPSIISRRLPTATRMIPKSSDKKSNSQENNIVQHSAPLHLPDWSKIYGTNSKNFHSPLDADSNGDGTNHHVSRRSSWESEDEYEKEEDGYIIPPHEWIARKLERSQISSFSVCEGVGRTLKGRDLSRVRNAVLTRTGFLESKSNH